MAKSAVRLLFIVLSETGGFDKGASAASVHFTFAKLAVSDIIQAKNLIVWITSKLINLLRC